MRSATIKGSGARRLQSGGLWVYANEFHDPLPSFEAGEQVSVLAPGGKRLGVGYVEPHSLIALRILRAEDGPVDGAFLEGRMRKADAARRRFIRGIAYRAVFSEADRLPGLILDRYGELCVIQLLTWGMERLKSEAVSAVKAIYHPGAILVRNDTEARASLGLPTADELLVFDDRIDASRYEVDLAGLSLLVDFTKAQKTGLYLDQVATYRTVSGIDFDGLEGYDLFCYSGVFGMLALKAGASRVTFVDSSADVLGLLAENLERNGVERGRRDIVRADVMDYLADREAECADFLFVDPPKFITSRKNYYSGLQGYFNLNRRAARTLRDGGLLFTFSCSHHAGESVFRRKVLDAIEKSGCTARELAHFRQNADHPVLLPMEESFYLKGLLLTIDRRKEEM